MAPEPNETSAPFSTTRREFCARACHFASPPALGGILATACGGGPTAPGGGLGSEDDLSGRVVRGPALQSLRQFAIQFADRVLTISA